MRLLWQLECAGVLPRTAETCRRDACGTGLPQRQPFLYILPRRAEDRTRPANAAAKTKLGSTLLHDAALKGYVPIVELLLRKGADVNALNGSGGTPLHDAALGGHVEAASLLLGRGASINAQEVESGNTALANAASWGRLNLVNLLLDKGADAKLKNKAGKTALMLALENGHEETVERLR